MLGTVKVMDTVNTMRTVKVMDKAGCHAGIGRFVGQQAVQVLLYIPSAPLSHSSSLSLTPPHPPGP